MAKQYGVSRRRIQRIAKEAPVETHHDAEADASEA
jgi:hypothetical protein